MSVTTAQIWAVFERMRIIHPRLNPVQKVMNDLRERKRLTPRSPQTCASLFASTQSGKSTAVAYYIETTVVDELVQQGRLALGGMSRIEAAELQNVVLHVTLSDPASPKSLASDILRRLGDPRASSGTGLSLLARAYHLMAVCNTELLVVDEVQHLSASARRSANVASRGRDGTSTSVTNTLKVMLINGLVPILFVGIEEARHHLFNDGQLAPRCISDIDYSPLQPQIREHVEIFEFYLGVLGIKLQTERLFPRRSNFLVGDIMPCVWEVAGGRLGMASRLATKACEIANERGCPEVEREHLALATDEWACTRGIIGYNPFRTGVRRAELR